MADLAATIRNIPLFSALSREDIAKVLGKLEEQNVSAGITIFSQGDKGDAFYVIQSGTVQVVVEPVPGRQEVVAVLGAQDGFGEMALLSGEPRSASVVAIADTSLWRLSRDAWNDLIEKHPSWLLHFCATISKRLARLDAQYSYGRDAYRSLAENYYESRSVEQRSFLRRAALLDRLDAGSAGQLLHASVAATALKDMQESGLPLLQSGNGQELEFHPLFHEFLHGKLAEVEGHDGQRELHAQIGAAYEALSHWPKAIDHALAAENWSKASALLIEHFSDAVAPSAAFVKASIERFPNGYLLNATALVHLLAAALQALSDPRSAYRRYQETLAHHRSHPTVVQYQNMAQALYQKQEYNQAVQCLRSALKIVEQDAAEHLSAARGRESDGTSVETGSQRMPRRKGTVPSSPRFRRRRIFRTPDLGRWLGGLAGTAVWAYFWYGTPDVGLEPAATKLLGLVCLTLIYWVFWVFPDYGIALIFALGLILTGLAKPEVVLGGFASSSWFMTLGVLGLGVAITSSGLFYRLSLQLVRVFPLNYYWQIIALGLMGVVVMALIPQQSARTAIISQMLVNLSESLGYKNPSKASTGLFVASFLGLGQLGFLFLTGSTTSLIAFGLLPLEVRQQFTWGYWFIAALPPTLLVTVIILAGVMLLYRPEAHALVSYKLVETQLGVLGRLSRQEWITLAVLILTITGWLTASYHGIDGAWIALTAFCVLIVSGVMGGGLIKSGIDWEMLIYMGATLAMPTLLTQANIDKWLVALVSPVVLPFVDWPIVCFIVIALITYTAKLVFTSFLTVVTMMVAFLPLAPAIGVNPWVMAMIILIASEVWFFRFQVDWHTMATATTDGKGFTYPLMARINPIYAIAYIIALVAAIPYWRYLGLMR